MFSIGEFSRFAQVTTDLLRHYDRLDLFKPAFIDPKTGYRYYQIDQLPDLNRILALKELGLSLEQIKRLLYDRISTDEIRGMLTLQRLKAEETIQQEMQRLQRIKSRLEHLDNTGKLPPHEITTKPCAPQRWLSISRHACPELTGPEFFFNVSQAYKRTLPKSQAPCICAINEPALETDNWEMGFVAEKNAPTQLTLAKQFTLSQHTLAGFDTVASVLFSGNMMGLFQAYNALGQWIQDNDAKIVGITYEVFYHVDSTDQNHTAEIQIPLH